MRRGQAAMEFMITYGWAILLVLVAIAVMMYFGVLNVEKLIPERCTLPQGFSCTNFKANLTTVTLVIENALPEDYIIRTLELQGPKGEVLCTSTYDNETGWLPQYAKTSFDITPCVSAKKGKKFKSVVSMTFIDEDDLSRTRQGEIVVQID